MAYPNRARSGIYTVNCDANTAEEMDKYVQENPFGETPLRGDLIENIRFSGYRMDGVYIFDEDGQRLAVVDLDYSYDSYGNLPSTFCDLAAKAPYHWYAPLLIFAYWHTAAIPLRRKLLQPACEFTTPYSKTLRAVGQEAFYIFLNHDAPTVWVSIAEGLPRFRSVFTPCKVFSMIRKISDEVIYAEFEVVSGRTYLSIDNYF